MLFGFCICSVFSLHAFILQCLVLIEESCTVRMDDWFFSIVSDRTKTWTWTCSFDWILIFFLLSLNFRFPSLLLLVVFIILKSVGLIGGYTSFLTLALYCTADDECTLSIFVSSIGAVLGVYMLVDLGRSFYFFLFPFFFR